METDKNYFLVGLFIIAIILGGFSFTLWLAAAGKGKTTDYRIYFSESVGGLKEGSIVRFHGVDVGEVKKMSITPDKVKLTQVDITILASTPVKTDTTASLKFLGVSGDIYVELTGGSDDTPSLTAANDNQPAEIRATESSIGVVMERLPQIAEKADQLLEKLNHTADQVNKVVSNQNVKAVTSVAKTLAEHYGSKENK